MYSRIITGISVCLMSYYQMPFMLADQDVDASRYSDKVSDELASVLDQVCLRKCLPDSMTLQLSTVTDSMRSFCRVVTERKGGQSSEVHGLLPCNLGAEPSKNFGSKFHDPADFFLPGAATVFGVERRMRHGIRMTHTKTLVAGLYQTSALPSLAAFGSGGPIGASAYVLPCEAHSRSHRPRRMRRYRRPWTVYKSSQFSYVE